jgi:hypothetical protein
MVSAGFGPQGQMVKPAFQGICPPTHELRRCHLWWPFGKLPATAFDTVEMKTEQMNLQRQFYQDESTGEKHAGTENP